MIKLPIKFPKFLVKVGTRRKLRTRFKSYCMAAEVLHSLELTDNVPCSVTLSKMKAMTGETMREVE